MLRAAAARILILSFVAVGLAGCIDPSAQTPAATTDVLPPLGDVVWLTASNVMGFTQSIVGPAVGLAADLYEPTMEVSDTGTIYVAGHVIAAATTGTPAYYSNDDGKTWAPLPFLANLQTPPPGQGSQPPPGDEGFIVAGSDGQAWMADIYLAGFSITGWCDDGATQCYDNRQAYDRVGATIAGCHALNLNDRPWAAYANGTLLLVNNPGGGAMQIGVMEVPPASAVGIGGGTASVAGPTWNFCASEGGGIPGIPSMREDGLFAVPQMAGDQDDPILNVVIGNKADIFDVATVKAFDVDSAGGGTSNGGRTAFDREGTLFVGARNNTQDKDGNAVDGQFILAVSTDDGKTFQNATFAVGTPVRSLYLDGNMAGPGALLTWSQLGDDETKSDWYVAHVFVGADGRPVVENVTLAVDEGPHSSAHVTGAAIGPDGRAYFLNFEATEASADPLGRVQGVVGYVGSTPISVWIQTEGATLPITMELDEHSHE